MYSTCRSVEDGSLDVVVIVRGGGRDDVRLGWIGWEMG